jgi:UDP:flavonoid glycosyltransferase YjiC (YdhE family)
VSAPLRVLIGAAGWAGHLFPALAVGRELQARGHRVMVETFESARHLVDEQGFDFAPEPEEVVFPGPAPPGSTLPTLPEAARAALPAIEEFGPDVALHDLYTLTPALAADVAGVRRATMMPHPFPEPAGAEPPFSWGLMPPRTGLGSAFWRRTRNLVETRPRRRGKALLDSLRAELGLAPLNEQNMMLSEGLTMVATFPQLEYPRRWPPYMQVTGAPMFELPHPRIELPPGRDPLVLVTASTRQDPSLDLIRVALEAFADEPVRVVASTNRPGEPWEGPVPGNAVVADWVSYSQVLEEAAVVICRGGHGTLVRALSAGVPVLVCPSAGDMGENATRSAWAGVGVMLPRRLLAAGPLRLAARRLLADAGYRDRAEQLAAWSREHDGARRIADLLEAYAAG